MPDTTSRVESDLDLFSAEHIADPFSTLDRLRELAPAVYMERHEFWLLSRYADVRAATADWNTFTSAEGVALRRDLNPNHVGSVLGTDPPEHDRLRAILSEKLAPRALTTLRAGVRASAEEVVEDMVARGQFDVVSDVARTYPINVISDLVGLPKHGRERLQPGADAIFAAFGPPTQFLEDRTPDIQAYFELIFTMTDRNALTPGSWGAFLMDAVDAGKISFQDAIQTMSAYLVAGMDTTVNAISALFEVFAQQPDTWEALRADPSLRGPVFEEALRLEAPVQGFFRKTTREVIVDGVEIPAGQRVMLHWGAANRDPRHYPNPARFDIRRNPLDHLAFGYGTHGCAGQGLARLEVSALLDAYLPRVRRFVLTAEPTRHYNPIVRSLETVPVVLELN